MVIIKVSSTWKLGRRVWILRGYVRNKHYELLTALHTYWKNSMRSFIYLPILALAENEWESKTIDRAHLFIEGQTWNEDLIVWQNTEECYHCTWVRSGLQWRVIFWLRTFLKATSDHETRMATWFRRWKWIQQLTFMSMFGGPSASRNRFYRPVYYCRYGLLGRVYWNIFTILIYEQLTTQSDNDTTYQSEAGFMNLRSQY